MGKKMLVLLAAAVITALAVSILIVKQTRPRDQLIARQELQHKLELLKPRYESAKAQGINVSRAEKLGIEAKKAFDAKDYSKAKDLLEEADLFLKNIDISSSLINTPNPTENPAPSPRTEQTNFSVIRVVSLYERIINQNKDINTIASIFSETKTNYIHRGFYRNNSNLELESATKKRSPDVYEVLKNNISIIKNKNPGIMIGGAIAAAEISAVEHDPKTDEIIPKEKTWEMTLDPQKYGLSKTRKEFQNEYSKGAGQEMYFPDLINPNFQKLFLDIAKKQIDSGVDAIWIDTLFVQPKLLAEIAKDENHPSVKASFDAIRYLVDEIHNYGDSKGKYIYVGSWGGKDFPYPAPKLDFLTSAISIKELENKKPDEKRWENILINSNKKYGNVPIIAVIDWSFNSNTGLGIFSQKLNTDEASNVLRDFDNFFQTKGILFAYPVFGGNMGSDATRLSYGKSRIYDSMAPEFQTYETIKKISQEKSSK